MDHGQDAASNGDDCDQLQTHSALDPEAKLLRTVRSSLEQSQYLRKVRCEMRQKVLETVHGPGFGPIGQPPREVQLINHLILEYLEWYNLQYTGEMLCAESGTARLKQSVRRQALMNSLNRTLDVGLEFQPDLPMLAEIVLKLAATPPSSSSK